MITLLLCSTLIWTDALQQIHFVDIDVAVTQSGLEVTPEVRTLEAMPSGEEGGIPRHLRDMHDMNLDGPIRQVVEILTAFDRSRGMLFKDGMNKPFEVSAIEIEQTLKAPRGRTLSAQTYSVQLGLEPQPGKIFLKSKKKRHLFDVALLHQPEHYVAFLKTLIIPDDVVVHDGSDLKGMFLADLFFLGPTFSKEVQDMRRGIGLKQMVLARSYHFKRVKTHLGSSLCRLRRGTINVTPSDYLHYYGDTLNAYSRIRTKLAKQGPIPAMIPELEEYLSRAPTDVRALTGLIEALAADGRLTDAYETLNRYRALFRKAEHKAFCDKIEKRWMTYRYGLMEERNDFKAGKGIELEILSPKENDTLGGRHTVRFHAANPGKHFLCADFFLQDEKIASISGPPFEFPIQLARKPRLQTIRLAVFFEDRTFRETEMDIKVLPIDSEAEVNLARLRAVVTKGPKKFVTDLTREDFELRQMNTPRNIEHFRRDVAPLRVSILMDTSQSMTGKKLLRAQFAVRNFLNNMGPEDKVSLYTFDQKVLRLSEFSHQYRHLIPRLFTLSPMLATSLYDAIYVAHRDLEKQEGNKVMIVLSDGADTLSSTTEADIRDLFTHSRILFYPILLFNNYREKEALAKSQFLHQLARMTGSVVYEVENANDLNASFDRIYDELKSFYYMDFYSLQRTPDPSKIILRARGINTHVRFHIFDDQRPLESWVNGRLRR